MSDRNDVTGPRHPEESGGGEWGWLLNDDAGPTSDPTREALMDALSRASDSIKPEPGMDGPHGGYRGPITLQKAVNAIEATLEYLAALSTTPAPLDVERLARAMHPVWFEPTPTTKPETLTDREWGQMLLNVSIRRADAIREADAIAREYAKPERSTK